MSITNDPKIKTDPEHKLCQPVFIQQQPNDTGCCLCIHEHENWGNNPHCKKCKEKYTN